MTKSNQKIEVLGIAISYFNQKTEKYISLTDLARHRDSERSDYILQNWLRNRSTIEFIGLWELFNNSNFNSIEFDGIKNLAGSNSFSLTPKKWILTTNAIGIISKTGRYGGTYAHIDIAFEFATWLSSEFKFYIIKEFQRLKEMENSQQNLTWNVQRTISKINYKIHTDAIKENLIPNSISKEQIAIIYANEVDVLNIALFGKTAKQWKDESKNSAYNIRENATLEQLVVLSNMESINAFLIQQNIPQSERLVQLNQVAITQMKSLIENKNFKRLK